MMLQSQKCNNAQKMAKQTEKSTMEISSRMQRMVHEGMGRGQHQATDIAFGRMGYMGASGSRGNTSKGLPDDVCAYIQSISKQSTDLAHECSHGLMAEILKKYMFSREKCSH